jgi:L-alanine-DL-glutamate epimerase-like enolase superfamily enzyme
MQLSAERETWPLERPFRISGNVFHSLDVVVVTLQDRGAVGRGEACGVGYRDDTATRMMAQIVEIATRPGNNPITRASVQELLPAGGARNALDCAAWELEARQQGRPVWQLAGVEEPRRLLTTFTVGADEPDAMAERALAYTGARAVKMKLTGDDVDIDIERVRAVRNACPNVWLGVDANQGYSREKLQRLMPELVAANVRLLEQPLPIGHEAEMEGLDSPIPVAADESVQTVEDLPRLVGRFDVINIKLDKCGGLTHALRMVHEARRLGFRLMVGNMLGTSWAMASAFVVGQWCEIVDLDGPLFFSSDRQPAAAYRDGYIECPDEVWGGPHK